ncbi:MAG TPA: bifunctional methylenetetrahydrofolate dehydrogenase/methenyltetrahydrofolate cyclohydrolase FolD [Solirubrobacteraceae bacterium]|jgi:methylenetetrahydrofolate dehydrogenase (NADP+)/methenyltetrahydrofolate cyclohydrolase|nr:bifunctional methylenetetrahydrofolate dehydrogenase/methenyltetrahydrofolate cyclohydrolase FolD [Solirubrobacteraceae bacterium]
MSATLIDGKAIAAQVRAGVARDVELFTSKFGRAPGLATVLVGDDPASAVYVGGKQRACAEVGMVPFDRRLAADASFEEVADELDRLNGDSAVSGVLLQLPLPEHLDGPSLTGMISPDKDVDGLTPVNAGLLSLGRPGLRPCTPLGVMELLADVGVSLEGSEAVVVGRSNLFGKPMAQLLLASNATVTVCHSRTRDLRAVCARAEVLIVAVGRARMVKRDFVKPGAVVIDVGMNRISPEEAGNKSGLVGDVDFPAVVDVASAITPVPGGVGPMTIALLLRNTLQAASYQAELQALLAASSLEGEVDGDLA